MLVQLKNRLSGYQPKYLDVDMPDAAVLVPVTREEDPHLILTQRSGNLSTHAGEVAFPGGKQDMADENLLATALRESHEEIGLHQSQVEVLGQLDQVASRIGIRVTPFASLVDPAVELVPNPGEIDSIFRVPIRFFLENEPQKVANIKFFGKPIEVPGYFYEGYKIWGLTAFILADFLRTVYDHDVGFQLPLGDQQRRR